MHRVATSSLIYTFSLQFAILDIVIVCLGSSRLDELNWPLYQPDIRWSLYYQHVLSICIRRELEIVQSAKLAASRTAAKGCEGM